MVTASLVEVVTAAALSSRMPRPSPPLPVGKWVKLMTSTPWATPTTQGQPPREVRASGETGKMTIMSMAGVMVAAASWMVVMAVAVTSMSW